MIGDPLFSQRLSRALQGRSISPEVDLEILGVVITLDGRALLSRLSLGQDQLIPGESLIYGGFNIVTPLAVVGEFSMARLLMGQGSATTEIPAGKIVTISLLYYSVLVDVLADIGVFHASSPGGGLFVLDYKNVISGSVGVGFGRWTQSVGSSATTMNATQPPWAVRVPANTRFEYNGLVSGIPLTRRNLQALGDDYFEMRVQNAAAVNQALTVSTSFLVRLERQPD